MANQITLEELAQHLGAELRLRDGATAQDAQSTVQAVATLKSAGPADVGFLSNAKYRKDLLETAALAVILQPAMAGDCPAHCLLHDDPYGAYATLTRLLEQRPRVAEGKDPAAVVDPSAKIGSAARIAGGAVIGRNVIIGERAEIAANVVIEANAIIGDDVYLAANVTIGHGVELGDNVRVQPGAVIGAEGFGYAPQFQPDAGRLHWSRIAQLGGVSVGNNVEIGANTTIDRGALDDTIIEDDVIIDNQVQVAHNVRIGAGTAIAGCVGIAGSAVIGRRCSIGGGAGIAGHLSIADGTSVLGMSLVNRSIREPGVYASGTGVQPAESWRKNAVRFSQLEKLNQRVKALEKQLADGDAAIETKKD